MKWLSIELCNFCHHRHLQVTIPDGLVAVLGPNGSGKSTFLGGFRFALTGTNPNPGNKGNNICDRAGAAEPSYVKVQLSHNDQIITIQRNLRPSRPTATLTTSGGLTVTGDTEVTKMVESILSQRTDILDDIVIVAQRDIFGFIDKTESVRADQFQRLFRTTKASQIYKAITDHAKTITIPEIGVQLDVLRSDIQLVQHEAETLQANLANFPAFEYIDQQRELNASVLRQYTERQQQQTLLLQRKQLLETNTNTNQQAKQEVDRLLQAITELEQQVAIGNETATQAKVVLGQLQHYRQLQAARANTEQAIKQLQAEWETTKPPQDPQVAKVEVLLQQYTELNAEIQKLHKFLQAFSTGIGECPTCRTPVSQLQNRLQETQALVVQYRQQATTIEGLLATARAYDKQMGEYYQRIQYLDQQLKTHRQSLQQMPALQEVVADTEVLQQQIQTAQSLTTTLNQQRTYLQQRQPELATFTGWATATSQEIQRLETSVAAIPEYSQEDLQRANTAVAQWTEAAKQRRLQETNLAIASTQVQQLQQQLHQAMQVQQEADIRRGWLAELQEMRDVVHKDGAPRFVAQRNLALLQTQMNEYLGMFHAPYRVEASEGLSFTAYLTNGSRQPAERLSEGQKVILALAFRLSLNSMFADSLSSLYLDEPTAYLDKERIRAFEPVLEQLRQITTSRGLQCLMITHEESLAPLFDATIQLT